MYFHLLKYLSLSCAHYIARQEIWLDDVEITCILTEVRWIVMFRAFYAYVSQERHHIARDVSINALSVGYDINVIEFLECAGARRVHRTYDGSSEMRQLLENINALTRGELVQSTGKKNHFLWRCYNTLRKRSLTARDFSVVAKSIQLISAIIKIRMRCVKIFTASNICSIGRLLSYLSVARVFVYLCIFFRHLVCNCKEENQ